MTSGSCGKVWCMKLAQDRPDACFMIQPATLLSRAKSKSRQVLGEASGAPVEWGGWAEISEGWSFLSGRPLLAPSRVTQGSLP